MEPLPLFVSVGSDTRQITQSKDEIVRMGDCRPPR